MTAVRYGVSALLVVSRWIGLDELNKTRFADAGWMAREMKPTRPRGDIHVERRHSTHCGAAHGK